MKKIICLLLIIALVLFLKVKATEASCSTFTDNFSSGLNTNNWTFYSQTSDSHGGIYQVADNNSSNGQSLIKLNQKISGDFSFEVTLKPITYSHIANEIGLRVVFDNIIDGSYPDYLAIYRMNYYQSLSSILAANISGAQVNSSPYGNFSYNTATVKVKISREGSNFNVYGDLMDGQGYHLIHTYNDVPDPLPDVNIAVVLYKPNASDKVSDFVDDFALYCLRPPTPGGPTLTPIPTVTPTPDTSCVVGNLLTNGCFFEGMTGWEDPAWANPRASIVPDGDVDRPGRKNIKLWSDGISYDYVRKSQWVNAQGNTTYTLSATGNNAGDNSTPANVRVDEYYFDGTNFNLKGTHRLDFNLSRVEQKAITFTTDSQTNRIPVTIQLGKDDTPDAPDPVKNFYVGDVGLVLGNTIPTTPPTTAKSCSVSISNNSVSFSGNNAPAGNKVRLWLTRQDKAAIDPVPPNQSVYIEGAPLNYTGYNVDSCDTSAQETCSKTYTVWSSLPTGSYYFHCDIQNVPDKCSGQPFCNYENPPMPGGKDCAALGYRSCSNNDNITYTKDPSCLKKAQGDANCDDSINGADYSMWLNRQCAIGCAAANLVADFNGDNKVDDNDYTVWSNNRQQ